MDHGKVHNIALMGTEEAQRSEEAFYIPEGHPGFHDAAGGLKEGAVRFFRTYQHDFFRWGNHEGFIFCLDGYLLGSDLHFAGHYFPALQGQAVSEPFYDTADAIF